MMLRSLLAALLLTIHVGLAHASPAAPTRALPEGPERSNGQNFRDLVLVYCLMRVHDKDSAALVDAQSTASVLLEWTEYDVEHATAEIDALIGRYLQRDYRHPLPEYKGVRFDLLKCLDLYHSKELEALAKRFVLKPRRSFRQDNPLPPGGR
jgi:hypothetical protein